MPTKVKKEKPLKMNVPLLRKILKYAEAEPRRLNMETWYSDLIPVVDGSESFDDWSDTNQDTSVRLFVDESDVPPCGAAGCMAGTAAILSGKAKPAGSEVFNGKKLTHYIEPSDGWFTAGQKALGLTYEQAERLFYPSKRFVSMFGSKGNHWPEPYASQYEEYKDDPVKRFAVLKARVEHFIETKGAD